MIPNSLHQLNPDPLNQGSRIPARQIRFDETPKPEAEDWLHSLNPFKDQSTKAGLQFFCLEHDEGKDHSLHTAQCIKLKPLQCKGFKYFEKD